MANGIIIIDKPADWTSMDVCAKLRGILHEKRIGHGGTLDPMATGVLPVFVGTATRAVEFASSAQKEYIADLRLGVVTNTQDIWGEVLETHPVQVTQEQVQTALEDFTGEIQQIPPMYSAVKIHGQKLYELARKGQEIARPPRSITIYALDLLDGSDDVYRLRVLCSKGTYVRTLCHDLGQALGCGGALCGLRRTMAAGFTLSEAVTLDDVQRLGTAALLPIDRVFAGHPAYTLPSPGQERRVRNGNPVTASGLSDGLYRVYDRAGTFLCLSRARDGVLRSVKNFAESQCAKEAMPCSSE